MLDKTYDAAAIEPKIAEQWDNANAFAAGAGKRDQAETYTIVIPPPNVTGSLHMGHALNNTLQDVLIRFERMRGKDVLWQPGMDHAGIATQMVVERKLAENNEPDRHAMGREKFVERVWEWKAESGGTIFNQLKRLGASCDWSRERFTMDEGLSKAVLEVFVFLYREGLIYRGKRLVNWDPKFETAISDLEVENVEVDGHMWHFKYPLADGETYEYVEKDDDGNVTLRETRDYISIATTRPETMLGDGAVAVHPSDERYAPIVGKLCEIPVGPKEHRRLIPIITDEYPDPEFGSGAVKITGAHDFNDYGVAKRNNIPCYRLMDIKAGMRTDGAAYSEDAAKAIEIARSGNLPDEAAVDAINLVPDEYRGLDRFEARKRIVEDINADGLAVTVLDEEGNAVPFVENKKIMQPFGDRSNVVIEPMLTDQWFADAETLARPAIESVRKGRTNFVPKTWENTYFNWMENIQPWCISRQLWWGHQIPAWYGPDGEIFVAKTEQEAIDGAVNFYLNSNGPWKAWVQEKLDNFKPEEILTRDPDVLDTWFSSALWPFSTLGWPDKTPELERYYPTNTLVTGFDIIFFWVARMMMAGLHFMKDDQGNSVEPFHTVYVHALVRDKHGAKMSKSKGNVIDPLELIDDYGADALRFTLAIMAAQGRDVKLDPARIAGYRNFGTKLWNASRFAQMNGVVHSSDFKPEDAKLTVNRWILTELSNCISEVTANIEKYRFNDMAGSAYKFVWNTFCDWYLELLKPVFNGDDQQAKEEAQACAGYVLDQIYKLLHPAMPFMTEELWQETADRDALLCHSEWPSATFQDVQAADEINWLVELVSQIRSVKAEMNIKPSEILAMDVLNPDVATRDRLDTHAAALRMLARIEPVSISENAPKGSAQIVVGEATYCLRLEGIVDFDAERDRLAKEMKKLEGEIKRLEGKLGNEKFVSNAPESVVAEEREKLSNYQAHLTRVKEAAERIGG
ncbi:MAG: valine--tRNA ligase [Rhizobiaceae bacterium]|nr:valine--tRNA ligase [Rhizobiaceae bacterium]